MDKAEREARKRELSKQIFWGFGDMMDADTIEQKAKDSGYTLDAETEKIIAEALKGSEEIDKKIDDILERALEREINS